MVLPPPALRSANLQEDGSLLLSDVIEDTVSLLDLKTEVITPVPRSGYFTSRLE